MEPWEVSLVTRFVRECVERGDYPSLNYVAEELKVSRACLVKYVTRNYGGWLRFVSAVTGRSPAYLELLRRKCWSRRLSESISETQRLRKLSRLSSEVLAQSQVYCVGEGREVGRV